MPMSPGGRFGWEEAAKVKVLDCSTKTVFGIRMLDEARRQNLMPEEVFSERNKMADNGTLTKVLTYDIIRQTRRSAGLALVDADNC